MHTFIDIFNAAFTVDIKDDKDNVTKKSINIKKIIIPKIQRDYAQGRDDNDINRIRERFLSALFEAVTNKPVTLDFIYGDIDEEGIMTPLDGQQRLTTLFLLHWYAAVKAVNTSKDDYNFLPCDNHSLKKIFHMIQGLLLVPSVKT